MATEEQKEKVRDDIQAYASLLLERTKLRKQVGEAKKGDGIDSEGVFAIISLVSLNQRIEALGESIQKKIDDWGVSEDYIKGVGRLMVTKDNENDF